MRTALTKKESATRQQMNVNATQDGLRQTVQVCITTSYMVHGPFLKMSCKLTNGCFFNQTEFECKKDAHCNGHGDCKDGFCDCEDGWTTKDCSGMYVKHIEYLQQIQ